MCHKLLLCFGLVVLCVSLTKGQSQGESCVHRTSGLSGLCLNIRRCRTALDDIRNHRATPQLCGFVNVDPVVCCVEPPAPPAPPAPTAPTAAPPPVATTQRLTTTTEYVPPDVDYVLNNSIARPKDVCEPLRKNETAPRTGQKAWDKCIEYQENLVFPCVKSVVLTGAKGRTNRCKHNVKDLIVGGVGASKDEFPHMVLMGYGDDMETAQWLCGGTLLSERFVLTAAHCTPSKEGGDITFVRTSALRRTDALDARRVYRVARIVKHPAYSSPHKYHDIALVGTDRDMVLDQSTVPACLDLGAPNNYERALVTGWGATENRGAIADQLQKVIVAKFSTDECSEMFPPNRHMKHGFDQNTQVCYGDKGGVNDTCQGDSGGPLQLKHKQLSCMYTVVGVTSFGRACGVRGEPGIYTRVAEYVPWIESVVWP